MVKVGLPAAEYAHGISARADACDGFGLHSPFWRQTAIVVAMRSIAIAIVGSARVLGEFR